MIELTYGPEEIIFLKNDMSDVFYILNEGEISLFNERKLSNNEK
jgi:CRP-like cAMP-binding protein